MIQILIKYYLGDQVKKNKRDRRDAYRVFMGKPEIKRSLRRPRHRWEDNIKMDLQEAGWGLRLD